jgi:hypothetical protein
MAERSRLNGRKHKYILPEAADKETKAAQKQLAKEAEKKSPPQ